MSGETLHMFSQCPWRCPFPPGSNHPIRDLARGWRGFAGRLRECPEGAGRHFSVRRWIGITPLPAVARDPGFARLARVALGMAMPARHTISNPSAKHHADRGMGRKMRAPVKRAERAEGAGERKMRVRVFGQGSVSAGCQKNN